MDEAIQTAIAFAQRLGLQDCRIMAKKSLPAGEIQFLVSGSLSPPTEPEPEHVETVRLFYSAPFEIHIRVAGGNVTWHQWDKMELD